MSDGMSDARSGRAWPFRESILVQKPKWQRRGEKKRPMFVLKEFLEMGEARMWEYLWYEARVMNSSDSLADLAFRLRDEEKAKNEFKWLEACKIVYKAHTSILYCSLLEAEAWVLRQAPKFWIAAALEAKKEAE